VLEFELACCVFLEVRMCILLINQYVSFSLLISENVPVGEKVYVEYDRGIKNTPGSSVWNSFLREDNGQSALCKLCDKVGIQKILKTVGGSTSGLHSHLKSTHKGRTWLVIFSSCDFDVPNIPRQSRSAVRTPTVNLDRLTIIGQEPIRSIMQILTLDSRINRGRATKTFCDL